MRVGRVAIATGMLVCAAGCGRQVGMIPAPRPAVERATPQHAPAPPPKAKPKPTLAAKPTTTAVKKPAATTTKPGKPVAAVRKKPAAAAPRAAKVVVDSARLEQDLIDQWEHTPLAMVLSRRSGNPAVAGRAAAAVIFEAQRLNLSASFIAAVLLVENTPMDSSAESVAGAVGLMQVMPMHSGGWGCPSSELQEVEANICHGTRLLHTLLRRYRTTQMALRRYNGCIGSRVTPSCLRYPARVLRTASRIRKEMLSIPIDSFPVEPEEPAPPPPFFLRRASFDSDSASSSPDSSDILMAPVTLRRYSANFRR